MFIISGKLLKKLIVSINLNTLSCVDLFPYQIYQLELFYPLCFQNTVAVEPGISDFCIMIEVTLTFFFRKQNP